MIFLFKGGCFFCSMFIFRGVYGRDTLIYDRLTTIFMEMDKGFLVNRTSWNFLFTVSILLSSLLQPNTSVSLASSYFQVNLVPYMVCRSCK